MNKDSMITVRVPSRLKERAQALAEQKERSMSWVVEESLNHWLPLMDGDMDEQVVARYLKIAKKRGVSLEKLTSPILAAHIDNLESEAA